MNRFFPTFTRWINGLWPWRTRYAGPRAERWTKGDRESILRLMTVAADNRIPLAPLLDAFALDASRRDQERIGRLAELIENGTPVADALEQNPRLASENTILAVRTGVQTGTLGPTLRAALGITRPGEGSPFRADLLANFGYLAAVLAAMTLLIAFMAVKIVPTLSAILADMDLELPAALRNGIEMLRAISQWWWLGFLLLVGLVLLMASGWFTRSLRRGWLGKFVQPWFGNQTADVLANLGVVAQSGRPLASAISTMARYHYRPSVRQRLLFVRNEMEHGADPWETMYLARLVSANELRLLRAASRVENVPWVLRQLAAKRRNMTWRRRNALAELVFPACILMLGALVLWVGLSVFLPLTQMIKGAI